MICSFKDLEKPTTQITANNWCKSLESRERIGDGKCEQKAQKDWLLPCYHCYYYYQVLNYMWWLWSRTNLNNKQEKMSSSVLKAEKKQNGVWNEDRHWPA